MWGGSVHGLCFDDRIVALHARGLTVREIQALLAEQLGERFPCMTAAWRRAWDRVIPFFAFPPEIRRLTYTTNAIESLHSQLRKIIKTRGHFPSEEAASKLI